MARSRLLDLIVVAITPPGGGPVRLIRVSMVLRQAGWRRSPPHPMRTRSRRQWPDSVTPRRLIRGTVLIARAIPGPDAQAFAFRPAPGRPAGLPQFRGGLGRPGRRFERCGVLGPYGQQAKAG